MGRSYLFTEKKIIDFKPFYARAIYRLCCILIRSWLYYTMLLLLVSAGLPGTAGRNDNFIFWSTGLKTGDGTARLKVIIWNWVDAEKEKVYHLSLQLVLVIINSKCIFWILRGLFNVLHIHQQASFVLLYANWTCHHKKAYWHISNMFYDFII